jgi:hypothetical protein
VISADPGLCALCRSTQERDTIFYDTHYLLMRVVAPSRNFEIAGALPRSSGLCAERKRASRRRVLAVTSKI